MTMNNLTADPGIDFTQSNPSDTEMFDRWSAQGEYTLNFRVGGTALEDALDGKPVLVEMGMNAPVSILVQVGLSPDEDDPTQVQQNMMVGLLNYPRSEFPTFEGAHGALVSLLETVLDNLRHAQVTEPVFRKD